MFFLFLASAVYFVCPFDWLPFCAMRSRSAKKLNSCGTGGGVHVGNASDVSEERSCYDTGMVIQDKG